MHSTNDSRFTRQGPNARHNRHAKAERSGKGKEKGKGTLPILIVRPYEIKGSVPFIFTKGLKGVTLAGHSMGCSVIWGYWELYGSERLSKLVLIDQMPMITANPIWSDKEKEDAGAILDKNSLYDVTNSLAGADGVKTTEGFITGMFTKQYSRDELNWVIQQNLKMPRPYSARLLYDHATNDWRDQIPRINIPTLVIGAKTSLVGWKSQQWIGSQIKGARVEIFEESEGGNHFMFMENPEKFNRIVKEFIG